MKGNDLISQRIHKSRGAHSRWVTMQRVMRFIYQLRKCRGHNNQHSTALSHNSTNTLMFCNTTQNPKYNDKKEVMICKHTYDDVLIYQLRKCRGHNNRRCSSTQSYKYTAVLQYYTKTPNTMIKKK